MAKPVQNILFASGSSFFASASSSLLTLSLAAHYFAVRNSSFESALAIAITWLPGVLLLILGGAWADRYSQKNLWFVSELGSFITISCIALSIYGNAWNLVLHLLFIKGIFEAMTRVLRTASVSSLVVPEKKGQAATWTQTFYYIGSGFAGLLGAWILEVRSVLEASLLSALLQLMSPMLLLCLKERSTSVQYASTDPKQKWFFGHNFRKLLNIVCERPEIMTSMSFLILTGIFFQGTYTFFETIVPIHRFGLGASAAAHAYTIGMASTILGAFVYQASSERWFRSALDFKIFKLRILILIALAAALFLALFVGSSLWVTASLFAAFVILYEVIFLASYSRFVQEVPTDVLGDMSSVLHAIAPIGQAALVLGLGMVFPRVPHFLSITATLLTLFLTLLLITLRIETLMSRGNRPHKSQAAKS